MMRKGDSQQKVNKLPMAIIPKQEENENASSPEKNNHVD